MTVTPGEDALVHLRALVAHFWPDGEVAEWLRPIRRRYMLGWLTSKGRLAEASARRALRGTFDRSIKLQGMVAGQLVRAIAAYDRLQSRGANGNEAEGTTSKQFLGTNPMRRDPSSGPE